MEQLQIRPATRDDLDRIASIVADPPSANQVGIAGNARRAVMMGRLLVIAGVSLQLESTVVALQDGRIVGMMDAARDHREPELSPRTALRLVLPLLRAGGPAGSWRLLRSRPVWARVSFPTDAASFYIAELNVDAACRNRGIGAALRRHAEEQARMLACPRITLTTDIINPARRLYERHGFTVAATKTDVANEQYGGSPGRVLMVRELR